MYLKKVTVSSLVAGVHWLVASNTFAGPPDSQGLADQVWPTKSWAVSTPEEQGMESGDLTGIAVITVNREHRRFEQDLRARRAIVQRRCTNSQLLTISDAAYQAGLQRLERELEGSAALVRPDHVCLVAVCGDKQAGPSRSRSVLKWNL
jgi:hypothetical protein